jgi:transposase
MIGVTKAISNSVYYKAIDALREANKAGEISKKLQAIKSAKEHGIKKVAEVFGVSRVTIMSWVKKFYEGGISALQLQSGRGKKEYLTVDEKNIIKQIVNENPNITIKALGIKINKMFKKNLCKSAIHKMLKRLSLSYITPRPVHYKQDKTHHDEFKKKSKK